MNISSRTPEGNPNHCPVCKKKICIEPSVLFGDAPCPNCGCLLWFVVSGSDTRFLPFEESADLREQVIKIIAEHLSVNENTVLNDPSIWKKLGVDSLDMVELVMELEEEIESAR